MNYFDTSALIKRFVEEAGSTTVEAILTADPLLATSKVAYAECTPGPQESDAKRPSRRHRIVGPSRSFDADWQAYVRVDLADALLLDVRELVRRHPLRGFDAIHLASAKLCGSN